MDTAIAGRSRMHTCVALVVGAELPTRSHRHRVVLRRVDIAGTMAWSAILHRRDLGLRRPLHDRGRQTQPAAPSAATTSPLGLAEAHTGAIRLPNEPTTLQSARQSSLLAEHSCDRRSGLARPAPWKRLSRPRLLQGHLTHRHWRCRDPRRCSQ